MKKILVFILVLMMVFPVQAFAYFSPEKPSEKTGDNNGIFEISVKTESKWISAGNLSFGKFQETKEIDLSEYLKIDNSIIKITQKGGGASYLDAVMLDGSAPVKANGSEGKTINKLAEEDFDITPVGDGIILEFSANSGEGILSVSGRIENEVISKEPLQFPIANNYKYKNQITDFYNYKLNSNIGKITVDGVLDEVKTMETFAKEYQVPGSGHPAGDTYFWVMNDDENLYVTMDFTPDNTYDGDKDYANVYVNTDEGIKEFKVSVPETTWGSAGFTYTGKAVYEHKVYEFVIPLSELGNITDTLELAFVGYGTAALPPLVGLPRLAYDPDNDIYLSVFQNSELVYDDYNMPQVYGQFVYKNDDGTETVCQKFLISDIIGDIPIPSEFPDVAYDTENKKFLVVWSQGFSIVGKTITVDSVDRDFEEIMCTQGESFNIFSYTEESYNYVTSPAIAFDNTENKFLVVWEDRYYSEEDDRDYVIIKGGFIDLSSAGELLPPITVSLIDDEYDKFPSVCYSKGNQSFLVTWLSKSERIIQGREITCTGTNNVPTSFDELIIIRPYEEDAKAYGQSVAINDDTNEFLVTWGEDGTIYGAKINIGVPNTVSDPIEISLYSNAFHSTSFYDGKGSMLCLWNDKEGYEDVGSIKMKTIGENEISDIFDPEPTDLNNWGSKYFNLIDSCGNGKGDVLVAYGRYPSDLTEFIGYRFNISLNESFQPNLAYHSELDIYMSVFTYEIFDTGESYVYGQLIGNNGNPIGGKFLINDGTDDEYPGAGQLQLPSVAVDKNNDFLVTWSQDFSSSKIYAAKVEITELDESYNVDVGTAFRVSKNEDSTNVGYDEHSPDIAYDSLTDRFLVVWQQYRNESSPDPSDSSDNIFGSIVSIDGEIKNSTFPICDTPDSDQKYPSVSYSTSDKKYLVAWQEDAGDFIIVDAIAVGDDGEVSSDNKLNVAVDATNPDVSYNENNNKFLITWSGKNNVYGTYYNIGSLDELIEFDISKNTFGSEYSSEFYPASYFDGIDRMLCVWGPGVFDLYFDDDDEWKYAKLNYLNNDGTIGTPFFTDNDEDDRDYLAYESPIAISGNMNGQFLIAYEIVEYYMGEYDIKHIGYRLIDDSSEPLPQPYIVFNSDVYEVEEGDTTQAKVTLYNFFPTLYKGTNEGIDVTEYVTYEFNSDYITVDSSGIITGVNPTPTNEPATITAYLNPPKTELTFLSMDYSEEEPDISEDALIAVAKVVVVKPKDPGLEFVDAPYEVQVGKTIQAKVKYFDGIEYIDVPDEEFEYKSENPEIATITSGGAIAGVAVGRTTISAIYRTFINDVPTTLSAITSVNVYKKSEPRPTSAPEKPVIGQVIVDNKVIKNIYPEDLLSDGGIYSFEASKTGDNAKLWLLGSYYKQIADKNPKGTLQLIWDAASYNLPLKSEEVLKEVNSISGSKVNIILDKETDKRLIDSAVAAVDKLSGKMVSGLVDFEVTIEGKSKAVSIDSYDLYVERTIDQLNELDSYSTTAMKLILDDEVFTFAPSVLNGDTAAIKYRGNGIFAVINNPKTFNDIANHWSKMNVEKLAARNIAFGKDESTFAPNDLVTRAEFAVMITRALGITEEEGTMDFDDAKGWFAEDISTAYTAGLINGKSDGKFYPNERIQRKDMAVIIHNAIKFADKDVKVNNVEKILSMFADSAEIDEYAKESTAICADAGIIMGRDNKEFDPDENATRAEASAIIERMLRYLEFIN